MAADDRKAWRDEVAEEMIRQIEAGTAPWQKPWTAGVFGQGPFNPVSGKPYRGINSLWLDMRGHEDPRWLTYRQAQSLGAQVRQGERSTTIEYWQWTERRPVLDAAGKPVLDGDNKQRYEETRLQRPKVFYAKVFNASQIDGLEPYKAPEPTFEPLAAAERIFATSGVKIHFDQSDRAFYSPVRDSIHQPPRAAFRDAYEFYATALHELGHATGHKSRMDREFGPFGTEVYAREELRAEMASYMVGRELGIGHYPERHASYVASWLKVLKDDKALLFQAARDAERIATWLQDPEKRQEIEQEMKAQRQGAKMDQAQDQQNEPVAGDVQRQPKIWLQVPFGDKEAAKAAGARWDRQHKSWYVREGHDLDAVKQWRTASPAVATTVDPVQAFGAFLADQGVVLKDAPIMDGKWHRAALEDDKPGATSAAYRGFLDGRPNGQLQNHKSGEKPKWIADGEMATPADREALRVQAEAQRVARAKELEATRAQAAAQAERIWSEVAEFKNTHGHRGYLGAKGVGAYGIRNDEGGLYVPMRDIDGKLHSLQTIHDDGTKSFLKNGRMKGLMHIIDPKEELGRHDPGVGENTRARTGDIKPNTVFVAEGYSTAASLHEITGRPTIAAFNAGNLHDVAKAVQGRYPNAHIVIAADNDHKLEGKPIGNVGLLKAGTAAASLGVDVIAPNLSAADKVQGLTDWNDLHRRRGPDFVLHEIRAQLKDQQIRYDKFVREVERDVVNKHRSPSLLGRAVQKAREGLGL